jgi:hypothetical protein
MKTNCERYLSKLFRSEEYCGLRMRCAGHVAQVGEERNAYRLFVGKPEGKRPLG